MHSYLDESGDLGFNFTLPNRQGGSSRFLTIAHIAFEDNKTVKAERFMKDTMKVLGYKSKVEVKGSNLDDTKALMAAKKIAHFVSKSEDVKIGCIVAKKENIINALRNDTNILYNFLVGDLVCNYYSKFPDVYFLPDKRSIKTERGYCIEKYLKNKIKGELQSESVIFYNPLESTNEPCIWLADWKANFMWRKYEDGRNEPFDYLRQHLHSSKMFVRTKYF